MGQSERSVECLINLMVVDPQLLANMELALCPQQVLSTICDAASCTVLSSVVFLVLWQAVEMPGRHAHMCRQGNEWGREVSRELGGKSE
jgi:hypothetical protein